MTVNQLLAWADEVRPNRLSDAVKLGFVNDIESMVQSDILHRDAADPLLLDAVTAGEAYVKGGTADVRAVGYSMMMSAILLPLREDGDRFILYGEDAGDAEMIVKDPFARLYQWYIAAMISLSGGNSEVYSGDMAMFHRAWSEYAAWYMRTYGR